MTWEISLNNARFYAFHGVHPEEQIAGNWFEVSIRVQTTGIPEVPRALEETLDYGYLYLVAKREMNRKEALIETVAGRIGRSLMDHYSKIASIEVTIQKLSPGIGGTTHNTAVKAIFDVSSQR
jgi:dihydroneopterin aldolase